MYPTGETTYSIPLPQDVEDARLKYSLPEFSEPAVVAKRGGEIVGVIGSHYMGDMHIAGPFVADSPLIALRLSLLYEEILRQCGASKYVFSVKKDNPWIRIVERLNFTPIKDDGVSVWFKRDLLWPIRTTTA